MFRIRIRKTNRQAAARPAALLASILFLAGGGAASGQSLNWEGQTGVFVTPLAGWGLPGLESSGRSRSRPWQLRARGDALLSPRRSARARTAA